MGAACSVCGGKKEESSKKGAFRGIAEDGNRIPRIWYEPTESGGINATDRDTGIRKAEDGGSLPEDDEAKARLDEWRKQQKTAAEKEKQELEAFLAAEETLQSDTSDEAKVAEAKRIIEEYEQKKAKDDAEMKQAKRVAKARELHEAEEERYAKEQAQKRAQSKTIAKPDADTLATEAKEKASKWLGTS